MSILGFLSDRSTPPAMQTNQGTCIDTQTALATSAGYKTSHNDWVVCFSAFQELFVFLCLSPSSSTPAWPAATTLLSGPSLFTFRPSSSSSSSAGRPLRSRTCPSSRSWCPRTATGWSSRRTGEVTDSQWWGKSSNSLSLHRVIQRGSRGTFVNTQARTTCLRVFQLFDGVHDIPPSAGMPSLWWPISQCTLWPGCSFTSRLSTLWTPPSQTTWARWTSLCSG